MCLSKLLLNAAVTVYSVANSQKLSIQNPFDILKVGLTCLCRLLQIFDALLNGDLIPYPTYLYNITGSTNYYNILRTSLGTRMLIEYVRKCWIEVYSPVWSGIYSFYLYVVY